MKRLLVTLLLGFGMIASAYADSGTGMVSVKSAHSVNDTLDRLETALKDKDMTVFARIDHAEGAKKAGKELRPTALLIFGNPNVGTPLMLCSQSVAIDLPQKVLAWQDEAGQVWLSYNDPQYLGQRHGLDACAEVLQKVSAALGNFAKAATQE